MLENLPQNLSRHLFLSMDLDPVPDPWGPPSPTGADDRLCPRHAGVSDEASIPEVLLIAAPQQPSLSGPQTLLAWGLKLKAYTERDQATSLLRALALMMWMPAHLSPIQVLLQDELKLKALTAGDQLKTQIKQALALLYWLAQTNSVGSVQA